MVVPWDGSGCMEAVIEAWVVRPCDLNQRNHNNRTPNGIVGSEIARHMRARRSAALPVARKPV